MLKALSTFEHNIKEASGLSELYKFLLTTVKSPYQFEDILRSQIVYAVSAFDKLLHDLIRVGMMETYIGVRTPTSRYLAESISIELHAALLKAIFPPKEHVFEQEIVRRLSRLSFQDPDKVSEGLSLIWDEQHKWTKISNTLGVTTDEVRKRLKLIAQRRNAIVHEADMHPLTNTKTTVTLTECKDVTKFLEDCGKAITYLVA